MHELEALLQAWRRSVPDQCVLATLVHVDGSSYRKPGARMWVAPDGCIGTISAGCLERDLQARAEYVLETREPELVTYDGSTVAELLWGMGTGCGGTLRVWLQPGDHPSVSAAFHAIEEVLEQNRSVKHRIEYEGGWLDEMLQPPATLLLFGTGSDARTLAAIARGAGLRVEEIEELPARVTGAALLIMSHHLQRDTAMLRAALGSDVAYLGCLGPRRRTDAMLDALSASPAGRARVYGPVGLDIGSETPEEIAFSVVSEVLAVLRGRSGAPLTARKNQTEV